MEDFYKLFQAVYAGLKYALGLNKRKLATPIRYLLIASTVVGCLASLPVTIVLYIAFKTADLYLRVKHGERYGGMVRSIDFLMESLNVPVGINVIFIIRRSGTYEELREATFRNIEKAYQSSAKLRYEVETLLGYKYYLKPSAGFEEHFTVIDDVALTRETLVAHLQDNFMDLSLLGNKSSRSFLFKQPIKWSPQTDRNEHHLLITSLRHSVGDGVAFAALATKSIDGFEMLPFDDMLKRNPATGRNESSSLDDAYIYRSPFQQNKCFARSGIENYLALYHEDEVKYVPLIKAITTALKVGFTDVLLGCMVAALMTYAKKRGIEEDELRVGYLLRPMDREALDMFRGEFNFNKMSNKMMAFIANTPRSIGSKTLAEVVRGCYEAAQEMKGGSELAFYFLVPKFAHLLTAPLAGFLFEKSFTAVDLGISNATGLKSARFGGHTVQNMVPFLSEAIGGGFMLLAWSIAGRLQLSFTGPRSLLHGREDLDEILAETFRNVVDLNDEIGNDGVSY